MVIFASRRPRFRPTLAGVVCVLLAPLALADTVVRKDGTEVEGVLRSVDARSVVIRTARGDVRIRRSEVVSIRFHEEALPPELKVEIRNVRSDDALDVLLDDDVVLRDAREGGDWVDLTSRLKPGNNPLRLRIRNERGTWAYQLHLRINGKVTVLACGIPLRTDAPCTCCGKSGRETGVVDDLPVVWLYVDRDQGRAEVAP